MKQVYQEYLSQDNGQNRRRRKVALFSGNYNYIKDGAALALNRLVAYLERKGFEVLVFSPTTDTPAIRDYAGTVVSVPSIPVPGRGEYRIGLGLTRSVRERLDDFDPDIIHLSAPDYLGYSAQKYGLENGLPVVASFHTRYETYLRYYGLGWAEKYLLKYLRYFYQRCDHVYVPTESVAEILRGTDLARDIRIWSRGVETNLFTPERRDLNWRQSLGIQNNEIVISFVGRLVLEKGLDVLADFSRRLERRGLAHRILVVGDGPARGKLEKMLPEAIFTGFLHKEELARAYASSDIFFNPSVTEAFGNVTLEAMACGVPTICADASGSRCLVKHEETGFLVDPADREGYVDAAEQLISSANLRTVMRLAARVNALRHDWENVMRVLLGHYIEILDLPEETREQVIPAIPIAADPLPGHLPS
ncbi:glycosyltransferase family 4 protein [Emcibacter nanhaiensis]|uniref:Glycosyltransferase family 1 protein n=1 Tax=Emcibacter nanhaiensis TaxID=1505037 RepID=A0A501PLZ8_9PROT|nr:glycosyltransferase family 1 protein [Emcibacter nanhaiensis]TPD61453.1 glycosyltransferase family 1 protein [Emcibacter nanhaiensis]